MSYEAHDEVNNVEIYKGTSKKEMIHELVAYIFLSNKVDSDSISYEEIKSLNTKSLESIGIKIKN